MPYILCKDAFSFYFYAFIISFVSIFIMCPNSKSIKYKDKIKFGYELLVIFHHCEIQIQFTKRRKNNVWKVTLLI